MSTRRQPWTQRVEVCKELGSAEDGKLAMLTKGDNNQVDDRGLYAARRVMRLSRVELEAALHQQERDHGTGCDLNWSEGKRRVCNEAMAYLPKVGMITIWHLWQASVMVSSVVAGS